MPNVKLLMTRGVLLAVLGWLATLAVVYWLMTIARQNVIATLSRPEAQADWKLWQKDESARQADPTAPVRRRPPKSPEAPALVLMRDSFPAVVGAMSVFATICYLFALLALHGLWARPSSQTGA